MRRKIEQFNPNAKHFYRDHSWPLSVNFCGTHRLKRIHEGRLIEPDVTRTLAFFDGEFGSDLANILLAFGGLTTPQPDVELWVGNEWLQAAGARRQRDRRSPDIVITAGHDLHHVLLTIEVKGRAWVNGGWHYCPIHEKIIGYSNQIICYADNCWTTADLSSVPRLLVGPDCHASYYGGWGPKGIRLGTVERYGMHDAYEAQSRAINEIWRFAGLRTLESRIACLPQSAARDDSLNILGSWLDKIGA